MPGAQDTGQAPSAKQGQSAEKPHPLQYQSLLVEFQPGHSLCLPGKEDLPPSAAAKSFQSCPTLCDPVDGSPPGPAVPGVL